MKLKVLQLLLRCLRYCCSNENMNLLLPIVNVEVGEITVLLVVGPTIFLLSFAVHPELGHRKVICTFGKGVSTRRNQCDSDGTVPAGFLAESSRTAAIKNSSLLAHLTVTNRRSR